MACAAWWWFCMYDGRGPLGPKTGSRRADATGQKGPRVEVKFFSLTLCGNKVGHQAVTSSSWPSSSSSSHLGRDSHYPRRRTLITDHSARQRDSTPRLASAPTG